MDDETKIERLEKSLRGTQFLVALALVAIVVLVVFLSAEILYRSYHTPKTITAEKFVVVDEAGEIRNVLGGDGLKLHGGALNLNKCELILARGGITLAGGNLILAGGGITLAGGDLLAYSEKGQKLVALGETEGSGGGIIDVFNTLGKRVATMQSNKTNEGLVAVYDVNGEIANGLSVK